MKNKYVYDEEQSLDCFLDDSISKESRNPFECRAENSCQCGDDDCTAGEVAPIGVNCCKAFFVAGFVTVSLRFSRHIMADDRISVRCHNSCYQPMGSATLHTGDVPDGRPYAKVHLYSDYPWLPDEYYFVTYCDSTPTDTFTMAFDGKKFGRTGCHPVTRHSAEWVVKEADFNQTAWKILRCTPGARPIIDRVIDYTKLRMVNRWRSEHQLASVAVSRNFVVETPNMLVHTTLPHLICPELGVKKVDCNELCEPRVTSDVTERVNSVFDCVDGRLLKLTAITALLSPSGTKVASLITARLASGAIDWGMMLVGTSKEVAALFDAYPSMRQFFPAGNFFVQQIGGSNELVHYAHSYLARHDFVPTAAASDCLRGIIERDFADIMLHGDAIGDINHTLQQLISGQVSRRIFDEYGSGSADGRSSVSTIEERDLAGVSLAGTREDFAESMAGLNALVGLAELKESIATALHKVRFETLRRSAGLSTRRAMPCHFIFTGNPGTGKTTVARQLGKVLRSLGLLSRGEVICTERSRLVGRYIGETEQNINAVLQEARGNVLFIDEAYTLYDGGGDRKDYGMRVIESLLTVLAQPEPDMVVVLAGYEREMDAMLKMNPGMEGRFPYRLRFPDYSASELLDIALKQLGECDYLLTDDAHTALAEAIEAAVAHKSHTFGNARWVNNFVENGIVSSLANRLAPRLAADGGTVSLSDLCTVTAADVRTATALVAPAAVPRRIGFAQVPANSPAR